MQSTYIPLEVYELTVVAMLAICPVSISIDDGVMFGGTGPSSGTGSGAVSAAELAVTVLVKISTCGISGHLISSLTSNEAAGIVASESPLSWTMMIPCRF